MAFTILPFQASALLNVITQGDYEYLIDEETLSAAVTGLSNSQATLTDPVIVDKIIVSGIAYKVTKIYKWAFQDKNLHGTLTLPNTLESIGMGSFEGCKQLTGELVLPESIISIGERAFSECSGFTGSLTIPSSVNTIEASTFYGCSGFNGTLTIPSSVNTIGEGAFAECSGFTGSLTIPSSVKTIEEYAFKGCSGFTGSLTIPSSVKAIEKYTFYGCSGFNGTLTIPSSVNTIGEGAFAECSGFTGSLTIPSSVKTIEEYAFKGCSGFTGSLTIPSSVKTIEKYTFYGCSGFNGTLTIPNSVTTIGEWAFRACSSFTGSLSIPNSVTAIGEEAFYGCSGFNGTLTISNSLQTIESCVFQDCTGFTGSLSIPNSVQTIGRSAFSGCSGFTGSLNLPNSIHTIDLCAFYGCSGLSGTLSIPNSVQSIGDCAFSDCSGFTGNLTIPNSIQTIESSVFRDCTGFTGTLTIPNSVQSIGESAFSGCSGLSGTLSIPGSVNTIGKYAFYKCSGFNGSLTIPTSVTTIGEYAFYECSGFNGFLTIPNSVKSIGKYAFYKCTEFTGALTIPNSVNSIGEYAFAKCSGFTGSLTISSALNIIDKRVFEGCKGFTSNLIIPISVQTIGEGAFYLCSGFTGSLTIPDSVNIIGEDAFYGCSGFNGSLTISNSVQSIESYAFSDCSGFTGPLIIPGSVQTIGYAAFSRCSGFTGPLTIPNSVQTIGNFAFYGCTGFTGSLTIPNSVQRIGWYAFSDCRGFTGTLTIPDSVTFIGEYAFNGCRGFTGTLTIPISVKTIEPYAFWYCKFNKIEALNTNPPEAKENSFVSLYSIPLYVQKESVNAYKTAPEWERFRQILPLADGSTNITLNKSELELQVGQTERLIATITPEDAAANVIWSVNNEDKKIISIDQTGLVTALTPGSCVLSATVGEASANCLVTVIPVPASSIRINIPDTEILVGDKITLTATIKPENVTNPSIVWESEDTDIATINKDTGELIAISPGEVNISATCGNIKDTAIITVNPIKPSAISINVQDIILIVGQKETLKATITPENTTDKSVSWSSGDMDIATVAADGTVTAMSVGSTSITATCGEVSASCEVTVKPVPASTVTIKVPDAEIYVGDKLTLTATVAPDNTTDKTVMWGSSTPDIAYIDAETGELTALAPGVAKITATCGEVSASCEVTVKPVPASTVTIKVPDAEIYVGDKLTLTATVAPDNTTDKRVMWGSLTPDIASIDAETGELTALVPGEAKITATCGEICSSATITVKPVPATSISLSAEDLTLLVGQSGRLTAKISPDNTTDRTIVWKSDNESVAIVSSNGLVTAISAGTASVTATCGSVTATCRVTVNARPETPKQYIRKGNGASCTFVVIMNLTDEQLAKEGYNFAYGYTDIHGTDIIISTTGLRYCHTSAQIYNDSGNDFWVYAYWKKEDGSIVSSMRRHLDGHIDEEFEINALNEYLSRSVNYEDPENWIQPTQNGAKICLTSNYNTGLYVHTMDGMTVLSKFYERGILVQEELISGQFVPGTYVVTVVSGEIKKSKKIIVR